MVGSIKGAKMANLHSDKEVTVKVRFSEDDLKRVGASYEQVRAATQDLIDMFGKKYVRIFSRLVNSNGLDRLMNIHRILSGARYLEGFGRHIRLYDKNNIDDHLLTAQMASRLRSLGKSIELEPVVALGEQGPDIRCESKNSPDVFFECKRIYKDKFSNWDAAKRISDTIIGFVPKMGSLNIELSIGFSEARVIRILESEGFRSAVSSLDRDRGVGEISHNDQFDCSFQKTAVHSDLPDEQFDEMEVSMEGHSINHATGVKVPFYHFTKKGSGVGVSDPPPDYSGIWSSKRKKSKSQIIDGHPFVVVMSDHDILGDPEEHQAYFSKLWLTEHYSQFSGIGFFGSAFVDGKGVTDQFRFLANSHAEYSLPDGYFDPA